MRASRSGAFRGSVQPAQWLWGLVAALAFAATVHAAIVLLFRLVPFPIEAFREGYDLSFIPSLRLQWLAIVVSATSAGICEETGFRGYLQQPIEERHGALAAIFVSSLGAGRWTCSAGCPAVPMWTLMSAPCDVTWPPYSTVFLHGKSSRPTTAA